MFMLWWSSHFFEEDFDSHLYHDEQIDKAASIFPGKRFVLDHLPVQSGLIWSCFFLTLDSLEEPKRKNLFSRSIYSKEAYT